MTIAPQASLRAELREVEHEHPGWHVWLSDAGRAYAVTIRNDVGGSGTTLYAPTLVLLDHVIAIYEHNHPVRAA